MKRNRPEAVRYAVLPMLIYLILFCTLRAVLIEIMKNAAVAFSFDTDPYYPLWEKIAGTAVIGVSSACAVLPVMKDGRRHIMTMRARSMGAWITKRKDCRFLMGILPVGTVCLSALMNILLAGNGNPEAAYAPSAALPLEAAVYGILTPFVEELVFRGIVWYRLRTGFSSLQAALLSSFLFGIAHADLRQGLYAFVMGIVFALIYELTRRFEVPFLLHCTCNLAVLAASAAGWGKVLCSPTWILFFAVTAFIVLAYWGMRVYRKTTH